MPGEPELLLVATHPRSGTHFCINSLCLNVRDVSFELVRGQYPTLERLLLDHDEAYSREFESYVQGGTGGTRIVKTHLRPSEIRAALESGGFLNERDREIVRNIMNRARCVCVHRDGRDVMVSWYHYMVQFGGGLPSDLPPRIRVLDFAEFLRMPNKYYPPIRGFQPEDETRPRYWAAHTDEWLARDAVVPFAFEGLREDIGKAIRELSAALGWSGRVLETIHAPPLWRRAGGGFLGRALYAIRKRAHGAYHRTFRGVCTFPPSSAFLRKGEVGDWRAHFSEADIEFFMREAGPTMKRLGYSTP